MFQPMVLQPYLTITNTRGFNNTILKNIMKGSDTSQKNLSSQNRLSSPPYNSAKIHQNCTPRNTPLFYNKQASFTSIISTHRNHIIYKSDTTTKNTKFIENVHSPPYWFHLFSRQLTPRAFTTDCD